MDAGGLNRLVDIQQRTAGRDAAGQPLTTWTSLVTGGVWANIRQNSGAESIKSDAQPSIVRASIRIRRRTDVSARMRVVHGATTYEVLAVIQDEASRRWTDLVCEVVA